MARQEKTKEIDGLTFIVQQLPGRRGTRMWFKLVRLVAPALAKALGPVRLGAVKLADMQLANLGDAVALLAEKLTPDEFDAMRDELLETAFVMVKGDRMPLMPVYDDVLSGRVGTSLKLIRFALEVNFGDFFGGFLANLAGAGAAEQKSEASA